MQLATSKTKPFKLKGKFYLGYKVMNNGIVYGKNKKDVPLKYDMSRNGYPSVTLSKNGIIKRFMVHNLVMHLFVGKRPKKMDVNHIDGNRANPRLDNLEYCTRSENHRHAFRTGLKNQKYFRNNASKMTPELYLKIIKSKLSSNKLSKIINIDARYIRSWRQKNKKDVINAIAEYKKYSKKQLLKR